MRTWPMHKCDIQYSHAHIYICACRTCLTLIFTISQDGTSNIFKWMTQSAQRTNLFSLYWIGIAHTCRYTDPSHMFYIRYNCKGNMPAIIAASTCMPDVL